MAQKPAKSVQNQVIHIGATADKELGSLDKEGQTESPKGPLPPAGPVREKAGKETDRDKHKNISQEIDQKGRPHPVFIIEMKQAQPLPQGDEIDGSLEGALVAPPRWWGEGEEQKARQEHKQE